MEITQNIITKTKEWLEEDGIDFFTKLKEKYGSVSPVYDEVLDNGMTIPHPVHFAEGRFVRNFLITLEEYKDWSQHDLDNNWSKIVEECIK